MQCIIYDYAERLQIAEKTGQKGFEPSAYSLEGYRSICTSNASARVPHQAELLAHQRKNKISCL